MVEREEPITTEQSAEARHYSMVIAWSPEDEAYIVRVPELPGLLTHGATHAEAVDMGHEAIAIYLASCRNDGCPVPPPRYFVAEPLAV